MNTLARTLKRLIDVLAATLGLAALSPILVILVGLELVYHGWPPFFVQRRPGLGGRVFKMVKFRSMSNARDVDGDLLPDAERLTRFGRFLRSSSLDELPELFNVLKGDMSLVGPRPLLVRYLERYTPKQARRHDVRPGITGWAQINGRNAMSWESKFEHDLWYIDNWSLWLDLKILVLTFYKVFKRDGISDDSGVTMAEFMGTAMPQ